MNRSAIKNLRIIRNVIELGNFLHRVNINPIYLILPVVISLCAAFFEGLSAGLLIPLVKGIINMDFSFAAQLPIIKGTISRIPSLSSFPRLSIFAALVIIIFIAAVIKNILQYISSIAMSRQMRRLSANLRLLIFNRYLSFGKLFFDRNNSGYLSNILLGFTQRIVLQLMMIQQFFNYLLMLLIYLVIMVVISWKLTILVLLLSPVLHFSLQWLIEKIKKTSRVSIDYEKILTGEVSNVLSCITLVKAYTYEKEEAQRFATTNSVVKNLEFSMDKKQGLVGPIQEIAMLIAVLLLACAMAYMAIKQRAADVAGLLVYFYLLKKCSTSFGALSGARSFIAMVGGPIREVRQILNDEDKYFVPDGTVSFGGLKQEIKIDNLSFSYTAGTDVLKGVAFSIEKGKMTAIVGPTGSGKTTLISLILRFYDCPPSSIFVDGRDIRGFTVKSLRSRMAVVSQDTLLFNDTIRNNITYGIDEAVSDKKFENILKKARLYDFVMKLLKGADTYIGDRGVQLSGGEKQRIAIARAFLKEPEILMLDEATSSLDTKTEKLIQEAVEDIIKGKTTIVIAHRLSTIKNADKIIVIEDGKFIEEGALTGLLAKKGKFYQYWEEQKFY